MRKRFYFLTLFVLCVFVAKGQDPYRIFELDMDAVTVSVKQGKTSKKINKKEMEAIVGRFKIKLAEDFPNVEREYKALGEFTLLQNSNVMAKAKANLDVFEYANAKKNGSDSIRIETEIIEQYVNEEFHKNISNIDFDKEEEEDSKNKSSKADGQNSKKSGKEDQSQKLESDDVFALLWGENPNKSIEFIETLKGKWDYIPQDDEKAYLVYRGGRGFLGIVKVEWKANFLINPRDYSLIDQTQSVDLKLSIPFGVKLDSTMLEVINAVNIDSKKIEKFKLRRMFANTKRYISYKDENGPKPGKRSKEKVLDLEMRLESKDDQILTTQSKASVVVQ